MSVRLIEFPLLTEGILLKRYKRFLADILLDDGREITAHCPNTGPMKGLISKDSKVRVSFSSSPTRKLSWTLEQVKVVNYLGRNIWVGVNTLFANKLIRKVIELNLLLKEIGEFETIRSEVPYGAERKSRIDFLLTPKSSDPDKRETYIEVKNTTWVKNNCALFPDTVTLRGQKHLKELSSIIPNSKGVLIPCITRSDIDCFTSGDAADPEYGTLFRQAIKDGLIVLPCSFKFHKDSVDWKGVVPLYDNR